MKKSKGMFAVLAVSVVALAVAAPGCDLTNLLAGNSPSSNPAPSPCATTNLTSVSGATGNAMVFVPDPMVVSGSSSLLPSSSSLDSFRSPVNLSHLGGRGVLEGNYVDVRNGISCQEGYLAFDPQNQFVYPHSDPRFQESMAYYYGDSYRAGLDADGYLQPAHPVRIVAHCMQEDNAFFVRGQDASGNLVEKVCLGDSAATPGASYADDAVVTVHELEHATTVDTYSTAVDFNQFFYDEAGSLNEAISDFVGLVFTAPLVASPFDPKVFSRWALGTFIPGQSNTRGAHKCPAYDSSYPNCTGFPNFSADSNTVSYVYPDGLGWPYANNYAGPGYAAMAFGEYKSQEEIHNAATLMEGALWDVYSGLRAIDGEPAAQKIATELVLESVKHLPKPSAMNLSPVTFRGFASEMVSSAGLLGLSSSEQNAVTQALTARGLLGGASLPSSWAVVGSGTPQAPGVAIMDNPGVLKKWLSQMGGNPAIVTQDISTGLNGALDPGEVVAIWFDIRNTSPTTAGGALLTVTSPDPTITVLDASTNIGAISSSQAQIMYQKINGTSIVSSLSSSNSGTNVPTGNSYFTTDLFYKNSWRTAIWLKVSPTAPHGKTIGLQVEVAPSNGPSMILTFPVTIN